MKSAKSAASRKSPDRDLLEEMIIWGFFHDLFRLPTYEQWAWLHEERVDLAWSLLSAQSKDRVASRFPLPTHYNQYEQEFLSFFEIGAPEPECPLVESYWNRRENAAQVIHENTLYYRHFGLKLSSPIYETPDHLRHQLEFMQYLCRIEREAIATARGKSTAGNIRKAREDFLSRHLAHWVQTAAGKIADQQPYSWPAEWMALLAFWCNKSRSTD